MVLHPPARGSGASHVGPASWFGLGGFFTSLLPLPGVAPEPVRTSNGVEWVNQEFKRRSRVVRTFPSGELPVAGHGAPEGMPRGLDHGTAVPADGAPGTRAGGAGRVRGPAGHRRL